MKSGMAFIGFRDVLDFDFDVGRGHASWCLCILVTSLDLTTPPFCKKEGNSLCFSYSLISLNIIPSPFLTRACGFIVIY